MSTRKKTQAEFVEEVKNKRPDVTVIGKYINSSSFVELLCSCGWEYKQRAVNLLAGTKGCPVCGNSGSRNQTTLTFIEKARRIHGNLYNYDKAEYTKAINKVIITCNKHGDFEQTPHNHLANKTGCPKCGRSQRWSYTDWEKTGYRSKYFTGFKLYIVRCYDDQTKEEFYKIGKTYRDIGVRFYDIPYDFEIIEIKIGSAKFISELEVKLHSDLKQFKYKPAKTFKGSTECFSAIEKE